MKSALRIGCFTFATFLVVVQNVSAVQVTYSLNEAGGSGDLTNSDSTFLNETIDADLGTYQFFGSVNPAQTGLIGVRSGFRTAVSTFVPGFSPDPGDGIPGGQLEPDSDSGAGSGPFEIPSTQWTRITIETRAAGAFQTLAQINGLSSTNDVGFIQFDWAVTGVSDLSLTPGDLGQISVQDATTVAVLRENGDQSVPDTFFHTPAPASNGAVNGLAAANLQSESILVPFDFTQLAQGEIPLFQVDFELAVETRLDVTNIDDLGNFVSLFDADFSNTATLTNVTVLDSNEDPIFGASVTDANTGQSLIASSVPEPSAALMLVLPGFVGVMRRRRCEF